MSSRLNHIDNNRSEDDEDDHINRLFPKCKPRASSLSLSPSLQHMSHDSTSSTTTSASDLCLNVSDFLSAPKESQNRNNFNRINNNKNNTRNNQCNNTRRHSTHSPVDSHYGKQIVNLQQNCWDLSDCELENTIPIIQSNNKNNTCQQYLYDNNNDDEHLSECLIPTKPYITLGTTNIESTTTQQQHKQIPLSSTNKYKKCDNHNFPNKNVVRNSKSRKQHPTEKNNGGSGLIQPTQHNNTSRIKQLSSSSHFSSSFEKEDYNKSVSLLEEGGNCHSSVIPIQAKKAPRSASGVCEKREDKILRNNSDSKSSVTKALSSSVSQSLVAMERNAIEDNCDNGIGSGCSRSSGESSNTSDFMENLVSPVVAIRGPVTSGGSSSGGGNGFSSASAAGLPTPSMGSLRDSRIEIAGGREVYSQNRIRASRRHRGYTSSSNEIMADQVTSTNISSSSSSSSKMRKKSLHSHSAYQNHHCCHTNPCCAGSTTANCTEVSHPPSSLVWEPNHSCNRRTSEQVSAASRQQYLSHSHSMGGPSQCVKCTHPHGGGGGIGYTSGGGGCCGHSHGFDYSKAFTVMTDFETGGGSRLSRNLPQLHGTTPPMSPMTIRETVFASEVRSIEKKASGGSQVSTEKPNPLHCEIRSPFQNEPVIYEGVVGGVGKVVFDDIGEWREGHVDAIIDDDNPIECGYDGGDEHDLSESQAIKKRQQQQLQLQSPTTSSSSMKDGGKEVVTPNNIDNSCISSSKNKIIAAFVSNQQGELMEGSPCASNRDGNTTPSGYESDECSGSACATNNTIIHHPSSVPNLKASPNFANKRVIGSIPIAEYEGSPKRYGLKQPTHPVSTHFDLVDVDVNPDTDQNLINHEPRTQSLIDQTIAAATSSSSSSLDNTNTNVSSNSSSRTNNHISPRALSPSQSISGGFSTRFPGFPQRVNATSTVNNEIIPTQPVVHHDNNSSNGSGSNTNRSCAATTREEFENSPLLDDSLINKKETRVNNKLGGGEKSSSCLTSELISGQLMHIGSSSADFSPDDSLESQHGSVNTTLSNSDQEVGGNMSSRNNSMHLMGEDLFDTTNEVSRGSLAGSRSQDLLYEFSETRKVLEEFFNATGHPQQPNADGASFDELDYMLRRQAGNSYVGQRLACDGPGNFVSEDSPKKPPRRGILLLGSGDGDGSDEKGSPKLISFQEISLPQIHSPSPGTHHQQQQRMSHMQSHSLGVVASTNNRSPRSLKSHSRSQSQSPPPHDPTRDINDNDIDAETTSTNTETDLGDTEVGLQVGHSRNFTLSPETTDCDSNELESELSLDYEASVHSSSRVGVTMPVVEDGLSSGNESENEDIIDVDVEFRDEHCYFTGSSEIKGACSPINRKTGNELRNGTQLALYQDNPDNVAAFFDTGNIPTGLLDWTTPSKNNSGGGFNMKDENKLLQQQGDNNPNPSDPNPTLMLMKKQISEIEKEIQLRASQQYQKLQNSETELGGRGVLVDEGLDINPVSTTTSNIKNEPKSPPSSHERVSFENKDCESESQFQNRESNDRPNGGESMKTSSTLTTGKNNSENMETSGAELVFMNHDPELDALDPMRPTPPPSPAPGSIICQENSQQQQTGRGWKCSQDAGRFSTNFGVPTSHSGGVNFDHLVEAQSSKELSCMTTSNSCGSLAPTPPPSVAAAIQDIKEAIQRTKPLPQQRQTDRSLVNLSSASNPPTGSTSCTSHHSRVGLRESHQHQHSTSSQERERAVPLICDSSPVWVPRHPNPSRNLDHRSDNAALRDPLLKKQRYDDIPDDDQEDTDQETDRLLGQTRTEDDYGFYDEKDWNKKPKSRSLLPAINKGVAFVKSSVPSQGPLLSTSASSLSNAVSASAATNNSSSSSSSNLLGCTKNSLSNTNNHSSTALSPTTTTTNHSSSSSQHLIHSKSVSPTSPFDESQVQLPSSAASSAASKSKKEKDGVKKKRSKEDFLKNPSVLIEGVLFRARYLGSTQLVCEGQPTKATRMMQAEEAVSRIKAQTSQNGTISQATVEIQQGINSATTTTTSSQSNSTTNIDAICTTSSTTTTSIDCGPSATDFQNSVIAVSNMRKTLEESSGDLDDYFYAEDEESCCEDESGDEGDGDEDLFGGGKAHQSMGSNSSLRDNKAMRVPLDDIHGSSNVLQIHDNHTHPISLHHNRQSGGGDASSVGGGASNSSSQPSFIHLSPPCGSALPGTMFRLRFIGSLEVDEEIGTGKRKRRRQKKVMVEEAVGKMKAPEGETQPSTEVDLFISTEKIMVLNTDLKEIMMDHALRTISYIADIGDLVVLMARRRPVPTDSIDESKPPRPPKMICHVFESDEAQYIAQSIGQAFQVAYMEFLKANGIEDSSFVREMDYQEVLNSQEIFGDELQMFAKKELQKEVVVPKTKGEILGVVIVESGWGSMLPTVVIANLAPAGAAARCGQLNIGDQIIAINGVSLVGLPLSTCQNYIKNTKSQTVVKLTVVPCPPVVEVKIKRPDTKYQLGFSVQNGVICSLLRGGIAERGGVRVGHRIIEINNQSVVAVPHEKIVNLLATSVGEINMKTMPTSMFRLLTGQETPLHI